MMNKKMKFFTVFAVFSLLFVSLPAAQATVALTAAPSSLVPDPILVPASSANIPLFSFTLNADAGETLNSVQVLVSQNATTTVTTTDIARVSLYKDDGSGVYNSADSLVGTNTVVNVGSNTVLSTSTSTPATGKFFVTLATSPSWSGTVPADSIKVTLPANAITVSTGAVTSALVMTNSITADTTGPVLQSAVAKNSGGTSAKEAGDTIDLNFSEVTNKPTITAANINTYFTLSNGHSFLDTTGVLGGAVWNVAGNTLTLTLSGTTTPSSTLPSVTTGDMVTVVTSSGLKDLAGNPATGSQTITGSFSAASNDDGDGIVNGKCGNSLINGRLYKIKGEATVYLAAACQLKPFRGAAVFHARGLKFQNIIELDALPASVSLRNKPVLPAEGALIKGSKATVWFVTKNEKRRGFVSAEVFHNLGFNFKQVKTISDEDLSTLTEDSSITSGSNHPDGSLVKCSNSATVFSIVGHKKFPFATAEAFLTRGHSWDNIVSVDCGRFNYVTGASVTQ